MSSTSASNSITIRLKVSQKAGILAHAMAVIAELGGDVGAVDIVKTEGKSTIRDITIDTRGEDHVEDLRKRLSAIDGLELLHISDRTFLMHLGGKIEVCSKSPLKTRDDLSMAYTPGVARVCTDIFKNPENSRNLTIKRNTVAVVTDGTAVLGLGDIGPEAAMPVMEGKCMLFKEFANVDAFPIALDTKDTQEIINTVKNIAPGFGGINLEDISAPRCFEIENTLKKELDIPVFHDDQHGTAVVMTAAYFNALKVTGKKSEELKVIVAGVGAAGTACTKMLLNVGVTNIIGCDRKGAISLNRTDLNDAKKEYAALTNPQNIEGTLKEVMVGADIFIGLSGPGIIDVEDLKKMNPDPIVFAMSNPDPEISPEDAEGIVGVMATGRSDYPNQINNVLCFPGIFRGALDCKAKDITEAMKVAAAKAIADCIPEEALTADYIIPSVFDQSVVDAVANAVKKAYKEG